ncbi:unnamed protein product [Camellia sinensis]
MLTEEREHNPPSAKENLYVLWECALSSSVIIFETVSTFDHHRQILIKQPFDCGIDDVLMTGSNSTILNRSKTAPTAQDQHHIIVNVLWESTLMELRGEIAGLHGYAGQKQR